MVGIGLAIAVLVTLTRSGKPVDAWCYYGFDATRPWDPDGCFLYSPPLATGMEAIRAVLPFEIFTLVLRAAELLVLVVIAGPAIPLLLFIPAVAIELNAANVNILIVGAALLGFRWPWTWAFVILTKVTPGVGVLWFAARREWRSFGIALGATLAVVVASRLAAPWMWHEYFIALGTTGDASIFQIWWRLPIAAMVVVWGARNNHRWALIVAVFLALPRWYYLSPVVLVGLFATVRLPRPLPRPAIRLLTRVQPATATSDGRTARAPSS